MGAIATCECGCNVPVTVHKGKARRFITGHQFNVPGNRKRVRSLEELFWPRVKKTEGCWEWTGGKDGDGYGKFYRQRGEPLAHRFSYRLSFGPIPEGKKVLHRCDNPSCVRPEHLFLGTSKENSEDMVAKGRSARGERQHDAKLNPEIVSKIRSMYVPMKFGMRAVACALKISQHAVYDVLRGRSWRWV